MHHRLNHSNPIVISDFKDYFHSNTNQIEAEFKALNPPNKKLHSWSVSELSQNLKKHRYNNYPDVLLTYDHTRVKLDSDSEEDFIAANWVNGINGRIYIVTQCPMESTVEVFFKMVWQHGVQQIVNLASPHDMDSGKGYKYYPDDAKIGEIDIKLIWKESSPDVVTRRYILQKNGVLRSLTHFHFQSWPDLETPEDPSQILNLIYKYRTDELHSLTSPLVVHCMAGVGRSGTFLLTDAMYDMSKHENESHIDFLAYLWKIRNQRISMVEKSKQYLYAHEALSYSLNNNI